MFRKEQLIFLYFGKKHFIKKKQNVRNKSLYLYVWGYFSIYLKKKIRMKMKELCPDERPREKMLEKGAAALSNVELLAILLRSGSAEKNAVDLAREVLKNAGGRLGAIMCMSSDRLCSINGIGSSKAAAVTAAFELGRRASLEAIVEEKRSISKPKEVFRLMLPILRGIDHEECWGLFLNRANYITAKECLSKGGLDSTVLDIKSTVRKALEKMASGMILVHNHPSGSPMPGESDLQQTRNLKKALETCGISLIDHIIVAEDSFYSFADEETTNIL